MANDPGGTQPTDANDATSNTLLSATMAVPPQQSAGSRVAHVPELLEKILLDLASHKHQGSALRTVLRSQRTCHFFRNTITGSSKLQRALYLIPDETPQVDSTISSLNPMFRGGIRGGIHLTDKSVLCLDEAISTIQKSPPLHITVWSEKIGVKDLTASWRRMFLYKGNRELVVFTSLGVESGKWGKQWKNPKMGEVFDSEYDYLTTGQFENKCDYS